MAIVFSSPILRFQTNLLGNVQHITVGTIVYALQCILVTWMVLTGTSSAATMAQITCNPNIIIVLLYSQKYWQELTLAIGPQICHCKNIGRFKFGDSVRDRHTYYMQVHRLYV